MIHPDTYIQHTDKGVSLFAKRDFPRGQILWLIDELDRTIPLAHYESLSDQMRRKLNVYSYLDDTDRVIVPWDEGKYVNHSCAPNTTSLIEFDNISVALRDIKQGEEIVDDYYCYYGHFETFTCKCGAPFCRGVIEQTNTYDPSLRLSLDDVGALIAGQEQTLLELESPTVHELLRLLEPHRPHPQALRRLG